MTSSNNKCVLFLLRNLPKACLVWLLLPLSFQLQAATYKAYFDIGSSTHSIQVTKGSTHTFHIDGIGGIGFAECEAAFAQWNVVKEPDNSSYLVPQMDTIEPLFYKWCLDPSFSVTFSESGQYRIVADLEKDGNHIHSHYWYITASDAISPPLDNQLASITLSVD